MERLWLWWVVDQTLTDEPFGYVYKTRTAGLGWGFLEENWSMESVPMLLGCGSPVETLCWCYIILWLPVLILWGLGLWIFIVVDTLAMKPPFAYFQSYPHIVPKKASVVSCFVECRGVLDPLARPLHSSPTSPRTALCVCGGLKKRFCLYAQSCNPI